MPRTADHVLFGRADLAGDATDAAHRPPMVERDGPRPHRGGRPLFPTSSGVFSDPRGNAHGAMPRPRGTPAPFSPYLPPPRFHPRTDTAEAPGRCDPKEEQIRPTV